MYARKRTVALIVLLIFCLTLLPGCSVPTIKPEVSASSAETVPLEEADTTLFIYMCGSDLETRYGAATKNIGELLSVSLPENVNIILQTGGASKWRDYQISSSALQRFQIKDNDLHLLDSLPNASMGAAATLENFLVWGIESFPAEQYAVILWDHGSGCLSGLAFDEQHSYDSLSLQELSQAFQTAIEKTGQRFSLIGLDACFMSTAETAFALSPYGDYLLASEEMTPTAGWDYAKIVESLSDSPTGKELGIDICDGFYEKCKSDQTETGVILCLIDLQNMDLLKDLINSFGQDLQAFAEQQELFFVARSAGAVPRFGSSTKVEGAGNLIDLGLFAEEMENRPLANALDNIIVYKKAGAGYIESSGISIYYPVDYDASQLQEYLSLCPFEEYAVFLQESYLSIPVGDLVSFENRGSAKENGQFSISLDPSCLRYVSAVDFELSKDGIVIGRDNNLYDQWDTCVFTSDFLGKWLSIDDILLYCSPAGESPNALFFTAPILLNGNPSNLRFLFEIESEDNDSISGSFKIQGAWDGIDGGSSMPLSRILPLNPGDEITILDSDGNPVDTIVYRDDTTIKETLLPSGTYEYRFIVTDLFGKEYVSDTAVFSVSAISPEEVTTEMTQINPADPQ